MCQNKERGKKTSIHKKSRVTTTNEFSITECIFIYRCTHTRAHALHTVLANPRLLYSYSSVFLRYHVCVCLFLCFACMCCECLFFTYLLLGPLSFSITVLGPSQSFSLPFTPSLSFSISQHNTKSV